MVIEIADDDCSLHCTRDHPHMWMISDCTIIGSCMFHTTNNIVPPHQRSCLHLSLSPLPLFLSPYLFPSLPSISLPIYFPLPPSIALFLLRPFIPSLPLSPSLLSLLSASLLPSHSFSFKHASGDDTFNF